VNQISPERLNGFVPNSRKVCLVPRLDEFECQGQRSRSPGTKTHCAVPSSLPTYELYALAVNSVMQQQMGPFRHCEGGDFGGLCAVYV